MEIIMQLLLEQYKFINMKFILTRSNTASFKVRSWY